MKQVKLDCRKFLKVEFDRRRKINPRYSLRGFAKSLDLDPTYLSKVMAGTRGLSIGAAQKIAVALTLSNEEKNLLLESAASDASSMALDRHGVKRRKPASDLREIDNDTYAIIGDMLHYMILEATFLDGFNPDPKWIARRFNSTVIEVEFAMARLIRLGLLSSVNGKIQKTSRHLMTKDTSKSTPALRSSQKQILRSALKALEYDSIERRNATGMTMAIDPAKIPLAKTLIADFTQRLCDLLESGSRKEIYQLSVNLFSLEKNIS